MRLGCRAQVWRSTYRGSDWRAVMSSLGILLGLGFAEFQIQILRWQSARMGAIWRVEMEIKKPRCCTTGNLLSRSLSGTSNRMMPRRCITHKESIGKLLEWTPVGGGWTLPAESAFYVAEETFSVAPFSHTLLT